MTIKWNHPSAVKLKAEIDKSSLEALNEEKPFKIRPRTDSR